MKARSANAVSCAFSRQYKGVPQPRVDFSISHSVHHPRTMKFLSGAIKAIKTFFRNVYQDMTKPEWRLIGEAQIQLPSTVVVVSMMLDTTSVTSWEADCQGKAKLISLLKYLRTQPISLVTQRGIVTRKEQGSFRALSIITFKVLTTRAMGVVNDALTLIKDVRVYSVSFEPLPMAIDYARRLAAEKALNNAVSLAKEDAQKAGLEFLRSIRMDVAPYTVPFERTGRKMRRAKKPLAFLPTKQDDKTIAVRVTATFKW